jgi:hypothetical protein
MSYYADRRRFLEDIQTLVENNSGKEIPLAALERKYGLKYGFSKAALVKGLQMYSDLDKVTIVDEVVKIK